MRPLIGLSNKCYFIIMCDMGNRTINKCGILFQKNYD